MQPLIDEITLFMRKTTTFPKPMQAVRSGCLFSLTEAGAKLSAGDRNAAKKCLESRLMHIEPFLNPHSYNTRTSSKVFGARVERFATRIADAGSNAGIPLAIIATALNQPALSLDGISVDRIDLLEGGLLKVLKRGVLRDHALSETSTADEVELYLRHHARLLNCTLYFRWVSDCFMLLLSNDAPKLQRLPSPHNNL